MTLAGTDLQNIAANADIDAKAVSNPQAPR